MSAESDGTYIETDRGRVWSCDTCGEEIDDDHYNDIIDHATRHRNEKMVSQSETLGLKRAAAEDTVIPTGGRYRPSWDQTWMAVADSIAERSNCDGRQVGAVIVTAENRIVSSGYNGPPRGFPIESGQTCDSFCPRRQSGSQPLSYGLSCPSVHAEANALIFADRSTYQGGTIYATAACCQDCAKLIANSGVARVVMRLDERDEHRNPRDTVDFLRTCGLEVETV